MFERRFETPRQGEQFQSEYDFDSSLLVDLNQRDIAPLFVVTLNLANAGSQLFNIPGRAFVPYFWNTGTTNKTRNTAGFVTAYVNAQDGSNSNVALTCKHNRGYRGSYSSMFISWTAQPGVSVDLVFHRSKCTPWMTDALAAGSGSGGSFTAAVTAVSGNYQGLSTDNMISATGGAGGISVAVPIAASGIGQIFSVQKVDSGAGAVTVTGGGSGTIVLNNQWDSISYYWNGSVWVPWA